MISLFKKDFLMPVLKRWIKILTTPLPKKNYILVLATSIFFFLLYHLVIWTFLTSKVFDAAPYYIGDLGRMSYQIDSLFPRIPSNTLAAKHFDGTNWNNEPIDLITIGDSFSNGGGAGKNPYYQDYLAMQQHINILNIQNIDKNFGYIDTIRYLHQHKWFEKVRPKAILIQSIEREVLNKVSTQKKLPLIPQNKINDYLFKKSFTDKFPKTMLINTANYSAPYYYIRYRFSTHAKKEIYKFSLTHNLFTSQDRNHLLVLHDDINNISTFTDKSVTQLNNELNVLSDELKKDGITLLFMPCADKYDLYYDSIENKSKYPKNPFFLLLQKQPKHYLLVDTKKILHPLLEKNIQDIYYADDTHWSYKASEKIANDPIFTFLHI